MPALAQVAGPIYVGPDMVLDSTQKDDEDSVLLQHNSRANEYPLRNSAIITKDAPFSNHGLISAEPLRGARSETHDRDCDNGRNYGPAPHENETLYSLKILGTGSLLFNRAPNYSRQVLVRGNDTNRTSIGGQSFKPTPKVQSFDLLNPAKRRKTQGAPLFQQSLQPTYPPILPPNRNCVWTAGAGPTNSNHTVKAHQVDSHGRTNTRRPKNQRQKSLRPRLTVAQRIAIDDEERLHDVAENHVLKHVRCAIEKYRENLPKDEQDFIARDVARKLLSDPSLFDRFEKDSWTDKYEKDLSKKAQSYVDNIAKANPSGLWATSRTSYESSADPEDTALPQNAISYEQPQPTDISHSRSERRQSSSANSTEGEHVFEEIPHPETEDLFIPARTQAQRHYSSSPTTSFSTEFTEVKQIRSPKKTTGKVDAVIVKESGDKGVATWSDEEQNILATLVKTQRRLENYAELQAGTFWKLMTSQLANRGFHRSVGSIRSYWHTRGRAKFSFEERTNPRNRQKAIVGGGAINVPLRRREHVHLEGSTTTSPDPDLAVHERPSRTTKLPNLHIQKGRVVRPDLDYNIHTLGRTKSTAFRDIQSLRFAGLDTKQPRPYLSSVDREDIRRGFELMLSNSRDQSLSKEEFCQLQQSVLHVDFCLEEMEFICGLIRAAKGGECPLGADISQQIIALIRHQESNIDRICDFIKTTAKKPGKEIARTLLQARSEKAVHAFLQDAAAGTLSVTTQFLRVESISKPPPLPPKPSISSLLRDREAWGMAPFRVRRCKQPFEVEFSNYLEDSLVPQSEWTDCSGDISAITWTSDCAFVCGATAHSDYHNMQYNKPGNLLVGSISSDTVRSIPNHVVSRPIVNPEENAENALDSMRRTQDPWLYTSVVSTAHSEASGYTFTSSFDETVKVWNVSSNGSSMDLCGTWRHHGNVNFVVTSDHHERVATAADVSNSAIRVYKFDRNNISGSPYEMYDCDRALAQTAELQKSEMWAYFPATIAWGKAPGVEMMLLVGYSPRTLTGHESDIPEDKRNSGELCLWNVADGQRVLISSAKSQNAFEVIWHPTQPVFLAATSPCGIYESETRTQIRMFAQNEVGTFQHIKALDCVASDINELTIMPNSDIQCYVTASCTDGNTYVWDTAQGDRPIHVLGHGDSLDIPIHDAPREDVDTGVKFAAWGRTADRFYTGSSDGKVKAWDIHAPRGEAFVRTVLSLSGGISAGAFSQDFSKLLIGDATGKIHLLEINDDEPPGDNSIPSGRAVGAQPASQDLRGFAATLAARSAKKVPKVIIPHPELAPPAGFGSEMEADLSAQDMARAYLEEGQITLHPDRRIGAVQGPNYAETRFYRHEAHEDHDGMKPLLPSWQARQQSKIQERVDRLTLPRLPSVKSSSSAGHEENTRMDFDFSKLSTETQAELERDRIDLGFDIEYKFDFELRTRIFKRKKNRFRE